MKNCNCEIVNSDSSNCNLSPSVTKSYMKSNESVKIDITKKKVEDGLWKLL